MAENSENNRGYQRPVFRHTPSSRVDEERRVVEKKTTPKPDATPKPTKDHSKKGGAHKAGKHRKTLAMRAQAPRAVNAFSGLYYIAFTPLLPIEYTRGVMAQKKKKPAKANVLNRRARFDYELGEEIVAGLALTGPEVRAARDGHIHLKGAYVQVKDSELWLQNASFSLKLNQKGSNDRSVDTSPRKILANRKQIDSLIAKRQEGMSIVPTKLLTTGRFIKIVVALGKGKKRYDKRETLKRRDQERDTQRAMKSA